jgi:WD40 repeat protein
MVRDSAERVSTQFLPMSGLTGDSVFTASLPASLGGPDSTEDSTSNSPSAESDPSSPSAPTLPLDGATLPGGLIEHYEIIRELGKGGMGVVLLARDTKLGRLVAIKLLHDSGRAAARLLAEAQATAGARHDNIVIIHEIGSFRGRPFMVLEYLDGNTLRNAISTSKRRDGRSLARGQSLEIMAAVLRALVAAHKSGIVHRDLKPENIMLLDNGQVKVLDFGLARRVELAVQRPGAGTRAYMAPEQWTCGEIDERTDIWAAGLLLYELLTGVHPLEPLTDERIADVANLELPMPSLRDARPEFGGIADIVDRCLRKRPKERFGSADELLAALQPWMAGGSALTLDQDVCPFAGLTAFQEADAGHFFGRERDIATMVGRLHGQALVAVAGPSGAGKSSFVRAGLIPALKRNGEQWDAIVVRPGRSPIIALREALAGVLDSRQTIADLRLEPGAFGALLRARCRELGNSHNTLVFVDQFEELYTLVPDADERATFLACLLGAADDPSSPLRVILAIRSDFLDRIVEDRHFMTCVSVGLFFLPPVGNEGLREALTRPVEAVGYQFESESMIVDMLEELSHARNPLPLLQFSAMALWEARDEPRRLITRESYLRVGGVAGALSTHADAVVAGLSTSDQRLCRAIFLRLVTPERTRAIVDKRELAELGADTAAIEAVVQHLAVARLLLVDTGTDASGAHVEIVHESMIERWATLSRWLDENAGDAHFLARLRAAATQWETSGTPTGLLWRDRAAEEAAGFYRRMRDERSELLGALEERYLQAVIAFSQRARRWRQRQIAGAFAIVCGVVILVVILALRARAQALRADEEADRVRKQNVELALQALRGRNATRILAANKNQGDPTRALALLREVEAEEIPKDWAEFTSAALSTGVASDVWIGGSLHHPAYAITSSPDGHNIALGMEDYTIRILGENLVERVRLQGHQAAVWSVGWSADSKRLISASEDKTARIWFVDGSHEPIVLRGHGEMLNSAMLSPDGRRAVTASDDNTARVWSVDDGRELFVLRHETGVQDAAWSPDGNRIVTGSQDGVTRVWNTNGRDEPLLLRGHTDLVVAASFHPDGNRIATASRDRTVRVWNAHDGTESFVLRGHEEKVLSVAWSPDGKHLATASKDKTARIWPADGKGDPLVLRGHDHWVYTATWSPDGRRILTTSLDSTQRRWNIGDIVAPTVLRGHGDTVRGLGFSPDGKRIATASFDGTVRIWNADGTGESVILNGHTSMVMFVRWSPDGTHLVTLARDLTARIWTVDGSADSIVVRSPHGSMFQTVDWSPDGEQFVTAALDGAIRLWSKAGIEIASVKKSTSSEYKWIFVTFDLSGKRILVSDSLDSTVYLWDAASGADIASLGVHEAPVLVANWSPNGSQVLTITKDGNARLWDTRVAAAPIDIPGPKPIRNGFWSPDGRRLMMVLDDATLRLWNNGALGEPIITGVAGEASLRASMSVDGNRILTLAPDGKVRVRNADGTGTPFVLTGSPLALYNAFWSPGGDRIAVQYEDKCAWVWPDVHPFDGPGDVRLWKATSYCLPAETRVELLGVTETQALADEQACRRRVAAARAVGRPDKGLRAP